MSGHGFEAKVLPPTLVLQERASMSSNNGFAFQALKKVLKRGEHFTMNFFCVMVFYWLMLLLS